MIESIFTVILRMSITSSVAVIIIILFRWLFASKLPRSFIYAMWAIVLIRLIIPFSFTSTFSIFNIIPSPQVSINESLQANETDNNIEYFSVNESNFEMDTQSDSSNNVIKSSLPPANLQASVDPMQVVIFIVSCIWFAVTICWLVYSIYAYIRISKKLKTAVIYKNNGLVQECSKNLKIKRRIEVFTSEVVNTPVVCGFIKPRIILPCAFGKSISEKELKHIITHEFVHIKRFDYIIKPLSVMALCLHWFNPLIWISFILAQKDMEMSCDERVLSVYNNDIRSEYATSLINISERQNILLNGGLLAFGESNIKSRIKGIMRYKRTGILLGSVAIIILIVFGLVLLTDKETVSVDKGNYLDILSNINTDKKNILDYDVNELLSYRSKYIGNASNVSNLLSKLPFSEYKNGISLETKSKPYGITINYDLRNADFNSGYIQAILQDNALILFSLIENVDNVTFNIIDKEDQLNYQYTRADIQKNFENDLYKYSKDSEIFEEFIKNISFKISVFPREYTPAMSIVPGMCIQPVYYDTDCNVIYLAKNGMLRTWDNKTGKVSEGMKTIELPYGTPVYWVPFGNDEAIIKSDILTISIINKDGNTINEKQVNIIGDDLFLFTAQPDLNIIFRSDFITKAEEDDGLKIQHPMNIENAVSLAIIEQGNHYGRGECITEGHIILDEEEIDENVKVYTISSVGWFEFENGIFTKVSGSGAIPTVITFLKNVDGEYILVEYKEPLDGGGYVESLEKMFPKNLFNRVLESQNDYTELKKQQEKQASEYLKSLGRNAQVSADYVDKELAHIDVDASNKLFAEFTKYNSFLNSCPYWIGTREKVEDGVRYIYSTSKGLSDDGYDLITFSKTKEDETIVEQYIYKIVGSEPQLINYFSPSINEKWTDVQIDMDEMRKLQESVDNGHHVSLLNPKQVVFEFFSDKLNISNFTKSEQMQTKDGIATILVYLADGRIFEVRLIQPIRDDLTGIWVVNKYKIH